MDDRSERERQRAEDRERRAAERVAAAQARTEARIVEREQAGRRREDARTERRQEEEQRRATLSEERDARPRRRASGSLARTGEKPVERDTRHYATNMDPARIRALAARGAKPEALAAVFGVTTAEVEAVLAAT